MLRLRVYPILLLSFAAILPRMARASDALSFFNNWFVTGDYAVAGIGLRGTGVNGWATGSINMTSVPANAEPIAAFLYWSTVETTTTPSATVGYFRGNKVQAVVLGSPQNPNAACFSSGGTTNPANGLVYRADVLRYLPVDANNIRQANGQHTVMLPDSGGNGNGNIVFTNGASLVVIYRIVTPGAPGATPLRAVVIYNGAFTLSKQSAAMTQNIAGFYDASASAGAKITNIVANGQSGFSSSLLVNSQTPLLLNSQTPDINPFLGGDGPRWDDHTDTFSLPAGAPSFSMMGTVGNNQTCMTWAAVVASTAVKDTDADGLLDIWETNGLHRNTQVSPATFGGCSDFPAEPCVNLPGMGAKPDTRDIFVQIDWMHGIGDGTGGTNGAGAHDHIPQLTALSAVAATFAARGINLHFDVGNNYQGPQSICGNSSCGFIIPAADAQGGSDLNESTLVCQNTATHTCNYNVPYPVLSFEFGFASVRDGNHLLNIGPHLMQNRKDIFHYALFAHALAGPFNVNGQPVDPTTGQPTNVPKSYSGIAHRPGGGFMVTFGLWRSDIPANDQVGSPQAQAGTLMHELGHNLGLGHAGLSTKPNCMPDYPSVMNYLYQTRGLTDAAGAEHVDYSSGTLAGLNESSLALNSLGIATPYRVRFYGPVGPNTPPGAVSQLHCDGTLIADGAQETRLEWPNLGTPDWSNGTVNLANTSLQFDANFDGVPNETFSDQPDWASLNLQQIGTGYRFGGLSAGAFATDGGVYATDAGAFATDAGALATDGGVFATDGGAFATDAGAFATDGGVFATDGGAFATDGGAFATDAGDLDYSTLILSSVDPPPPQSPSCPTCGLVATSTLSSIVDNWLPPDIGYNLTYNLYRCAAVAPANSCTPSGPAFKQNIPGAGGAPSYTDAVSDLLDSGAACPTASTCYNTPYVYTATTLAILNSKQIESGFSNTAAGIVKHLFITAPSLSQAYGTPIPASFTPTIAGLDPGLTGTTTCSTTATQFSPLGVYPITCSGLTPAAGVTYFPGTLTITPVRVTPSVTAASKIYDTTTLATITGCALTGVLPADTNNVSCSAGSAAFSSANAGTWTVTALSISLSGSAAGNYVLTSTTAATTATIAPKPVTPSLTAANKNYDGTNIAITSCALAGVLGGDAVSCAPASSTFSSADPGTWTVTAAGIVLSGPAARNYVLTATSAMTTATIFKAPQTITFGPLAAQIYGNPPFRLSATASSGLPVSFAVSGNCTISGTTVTLNSAGNCSVTASQGGNIDYLPAIPVIQSFHISGFVATGAMNTPRSSHAAALLGSGQVLVTGGLGGSALSTALNTAELYDPAKGSFSLTGSLAAARSYHTATLLGGASANAGKVLIVGGFNSSGAPLASAELFDPAAGTFSSTTNNMPNKAAGHTATWMPTVNKVLVVGGGNASSQIYDPATNAWTSGGGTGAQLSYHTATWIPSIGKVLIAGGSSNSGATTNGALLYDPSTGAYSNTGNMTVSRDFHTAVLLTSGPNAGKVLIAGGRTGNSKGYIYLSSAELYDPAAGTFTATASMTSARQYFTGMVFSGAGTNPFPGGPTVVEAGGIGGTAAAPKRLAATEQYPAGAFQTFPSMTAARGGHTATPLADGTVLIVGGQGSTGIPVASAEVLQ